MFDLKENKRIGMFKSKVKGMAYDLVCTPDNKKVLIVGHDPRVAVYDVE